MTELAYLTPAAQHMLDIELSDDVEWSNISDVFAGGEGWEVYKEFMRFLLIAPPSKAWPAELIGFQRILVNHVENMPR